VIVAPLTASIVRYLDPPIRASSAENTLLSPSFDALAKLVLYGSRARGDADSDVDVAIIVRGSDGKIRDQLLNAVADVELETLVPLSTIVFSEAEYQRLMAGERRIALDIEGEGITL